MPSEYIVNPVTTFLAGTYGCDNSDTSITVSDTSLFPTTFPYRIVCENEIMLCTDIVGEVITVTRGLEGTVASAHSIGTGVAAALTAGGLYAVFSGGGGGGGVSPCGGGAVNALYPTLVGGAGFVPMDCGGASILFGGAAVTNLILSNSGITPGVLGTYLVTVAAAVNGGAPNDVSLWIGQNGSGIGGVQIPSDGGTAAGSFSLVLAAGVTDEFELLMAAGIGGEVLSVSSLTVIRVN